MLHFAAPRSFQTSVPTFEGVWPDLSTDVDTLPTDGDLDSFDPIVTTGLPSSHILNLEGFMSIDGTALQSTRDVMDLDVFGGYEEDFNMPSANDIALDSPESSHYSNDSQSVRLGPRYSYHIEMANCASDYPRALWWVFNAVNVHHN